MKIPKASRFLNRATVLGGKKLPRCHSSRLSEGHPSLPSAPARRDAAPQKKQAAGCGGGRHRLTGARSTTPLASTRSAATNAVWAWRRKGWALGIEPPRCSSVTRGCNITAGAARADRGAGLGYPCHRCCCCRVDRQPAAGKGARKVRGGTTFVNFCEYIPTPQLLYLC